jgi:hypothetical protein
MPSTNSGSATTYLEYDTSTGRGSGRYYTEGTGTIAFDKHFNTRENSPSQSGLVQNPNTGTAVISGYTDYSASYGGNNSGYTYRSTNYLIDQTSTSVPITGVNTGNDYPSNVVYLSECNTWIVFSGYNATQLYRSIDDGVNFAKSTGMSGAVTLTGFLALSATSILCLVGTSTGLVPYVSTNQGASYTASSAIPGLTGSTLYDASMAFKVNGRYYFFWKNSTLPANPVLLFRSTDGTTWTSTDVTADWGTDKPLPFRAGNSTNRNPSVAVTDNYVYVGVYTTLPGLPYSKVFPVAYFV